MYHSVFLYIAICEACLTLLLSLNVFRIEHLELDIVEKLEKCIFGFIEPRIAIFTTPNSDFNVLLKGMQGKFRHYDHKFEWTRSEFRDWYVCLCCNKEMLFVLSLKIKNDQKFYFQDK